MTDGTEPAFAYDEEYEYHLNGQGVAHVNKTGGLTKREYFAAMAMQGLLSRSPRDFSDMDKAVEFADALIAELNK